MKSICEKLHLAYQVGNTNQTIEEERENMMEIRD